MKIQDKKTISILSLLTIGLIIFLGIYLQLFDSLLSRNVPENKEKIKIHQAEPFDKNYYETVYKFKKKKVDLKNNEIEGGIIPHHLLAGDLIAEFFSNLEDKQIDTIILIGPNHFNSGNSKVITSIYNWQTPFGDLIADSGIIKNLLEKNKNIKLDEDVFDREHSVKSEVAFIKKTFPETKFVPLVLKYDLKPEEAEKLAHDLNDSGKNKKILVIVSADFSHYKDSNTAQANDQVSIDAISNRRFENVYELDVDSPPSVYTLLKYAELRNNRFVLINNSNSAILSDNTDISSTTSYITGFFVK